MVSGVVMVCLNRFKGRNWGSLTSEKFSFHLKIVHGVKLSHQFCAVTKRLHQQITLTVHYIWVWLGFWAALTPSRHSHINRRELLIEEFEQNSSILFCIPESY